MSFRKSFGGLQQVRQRRSAESRYSVITRRGTDCKLWEVGVYIPESKADATHAYSNRATNKGRIGLENLREFKTFDDAMIYHNELMKLQEAEPCKTFTL